MYQLRFRHYQANRLNSSTGLLENVIYTGVSGAINEVLGNVPQSTYIVLDGVDGLDDFSPEWNFDDEQRSIIKSISQNMTFYDEAYRFAKDWFFDNPAGSLNAIEVDVWDELCSKNFGTYIIRPDGVKLCLGECKFDVTMKYEDKVMECFERTLVDNNWQGWFADSNKNDGTAPIYIPTFDYCAVLEPDFLVWIVYIIINATSLILAILSLTIIPVINGVIAAINGVVDIFGNCEHPGNPLSPIANPAYCQVVGDCDYTDPPDPYTCNCICYIPLTINSIDDVIGYIFGCNRKHPAPYIRDYILNTCGKCGRDLEVSIDFDNTVFDNVPSSIGYGYGSIFNSVQSPYFAACYFFPSVRKGIINTSTQNWLNINSPNKNGKEFLDELAVLFNAIWYVKYDSVNSKYVLYFHKKQSYVNQVPILDFIATPTLQNLLVGDICVEWNGDKSPAYIEGLYVDDPVDTVGNTAKQRYNDVIDYNKGGNNKNIKGSKTINTVFSPTRFYDDLITPPPYESTFFPVIIQALGAAAGLVIGSTFWDTASNNQLRKIIMPQHTCMNPKIIIHDLNTMHYLPPNIYINAHSYPSYGWGWWVNNLGALNNEPTPNNTYNINSVPYHVAYEISEEFGYPAAFSDIGYLAYNYPMYFDADYITNLYDMFFSIEDNRNSYTKNRQFQFELVYCCETLDLLGVWNNEQTALLECIQLPLQQPYGGLYNRGIITYIGIKNTSGVRTIVVKGKI